jgi:hypothetical protein
MGILNILKSILNINKKIDLKTLPSQGLFYPPEFDLWIKKANIDDITEYEYEFAEDMGTILSKLKKIVKNNTILSNGFTFDDIKSMDIIFVFIEIVKFTNSKPFFLHDKTKSKIEFSEQTFNYFDPKTIQDVYNPIERNVQIDGFRYTVPTMGVESCITNFIISKSFTPDSKKYETYSYDFIYFLGQKNNISNDEIENLIQIFNHDMDEDDKQKVRKIIHDLSFIASYSLIKDSQIIGLSSSINLQSVWK